jgi:hypothetical protein
MATTANGTAQARCAAAGVRTLPPAGGGSGVNVSSCVSINDLTVRMAWLAGLALLALVLAGWRKTARAQPRRPRGVTDSAPRRVPHQVQAAAAAPYHPAGPLRRAWAIVASSGLAIVVGAVLATVIAFSLAFAVTTLTDLLRS